MLIISLLQDRIQTLKIEGGFLAKKQVKANKAEISVADYKTFNVDKWALYLKEALNLNTNNRYPKQKIKLILNLSFWEFQKIEIPPDVSLKTGLQIFLQKKTEELSEKIAVFKFYLTENRGKNFAHVYALSTKKLNDLITLFSFYDLRIEEIYPEPVLIFQLFNQTLSTKKEEPLLYLEYNKILSVGCIFDYLGLREAKAIAFESKNIVAEVKRLNEQHNNTLSRLILAGEFADKVRQDNFTKETTVWTNPLQKIIERSEYATLAKKYRLENELIGYVRELVLLQLITNKKSSEFALLPEKKLELKLPKISSLHLNAKFSSPLNFKTLFGSLIIILLSAAITYGVFSGVLVLSKKPLNLSKLFPSKKKVISTPTPKPKPTLSAGKQSKTKTPKALPTINRQKIVIEVQNGAGEAGLALKVKSLLEKKDYVVENTTNADNFNYQTTVIITPEKSIYDLLSKDLKTNLPKKAKYEETNDQKTTIIIGKDFTL